MQFYTQEILKHGKQNYKHSFKMQPFAFQKRQQQYKEEGSCYKTSEKQLLCKGSS